MANLIIQENGGARTRPAVTGEEITIKTPCGCSDVTGVQINGVAFPFYDASGNSLADMTGLFAKDSLIRVLIDADKTRAYILNADTNAYLEGKLNGKADLKDGKVPAEQLPSMDYVPNSLKGQANGVATLDGSGKVPSGQLPSMDYIPTSEKGAVGGVAPMYTYGTEDIEAGSASTEPEGSLHFVIE